MSTAKFLYIASIAFKPLAIIGLAALLLSACEYTDTEPPTVRNFAVNNRTSTVGLQLSDTLVVKGSYTDDANLGGINIQIAPLSEPTAGRWLPPFRSLDTVINIGGIRVEAASRLPLAASRYAQGIYQLSATFFDEAGNQGIEENGVELVLFNPRPHIHLTSYLRDTVSQAFGEPLSMQGEVFDYDGTLSSLRLLVRRLEINEQGNQLAQDPPAYDTTFVLRGRSEFAFAEAYLPDSIGTFRFSALATDSQNQQTNMVTVITID